MAGSPPNFHKMDSRSACIQGVLKVKVKVKGHVIRELSWILGMSYSVIDGLVLSVRWILNLIMLYIRSPQIYTLNTVNSFKFSFFSENYGVVQIKLLLC